MARTAVTSARGDFEIGTSATFAAYTSFPVNLLTDASAPQDAGRLCRGIIFVGGQCVLTRQDGVSITIPADFAGIGLPIQAKAIEAATTGKVLVLW